MIECAPPDTSKLGVGKPLPLRLAHFSGAPTQCFRSSATRGVGQSSLDSGSVGRFEDEGESVGSDHIYSREQELLAAALRGRGRGGNARPPSGGVLSVDSDSGRGAILDQVDHFAQDHAASTIQRAVRGRLAVATMQRVREAAVASIDARVAAEAAEQQRLSAAARLASSCASSQLATLASVGVVATGPPQ